MEAPCTCEEDEPECYVCADRKPRDKLRASQCACKERFLHDGCLKKLVQSQKVAICMVCKEPYANVDVRTRYERVWGTRYGVSIILAIAMVCFLCICILCLVMHSVGKLSETMRILTLALAAGALSISLVFFAMIIMAISFGGGPRSVRREGMHRVIAEVTVVS